MLKSLNSGSLQSPRLQLIPEHPQGCTQQNKGGDHSWRSGRQVTIRSQVATAEPPLFFSIWLLQGQQADSAEQGRSLVLSQVRQTVTIVSLVIGVHSLMDPGSGTSFCCPSLSGISRQCRPQECIFLERPIPCGVCLSVAGECLCFLPDKHPSKEQIRQRLTTPFSLWGCSS